MTSDGSDHDTTAEQQSPQAPAPVAGAVGSEREMIEAGRRRGGIAGAALAGILGALRDIYDRPKRDNGEVAVDAPSEPHNADRDGMNFKADEVGSSADVAITAQQRREPITAPVRRGLFRRR
jgi:hypothetical protein